MYDNGNLVFFSWLSGLVYFAMECTTQKERKIYFFGRFKIVLFRQRSTYALFSLDFFSHIVRPLPSETKTLDV